jgi:hypothetical protein
MRAISRAFPGPRSRSTRPSAKSMPAVMTADVQICPSAIIDPIHIYPCFWITAL